jgi:glycosyltransferase involved in cell wall biosynthesis
MAAVYKEADVLVLTSDHEGTPNVLLEAMASGLPVVATKVGGVAEIVKHGETGYVVAAGDEDSLFVAILKMAGDENVRMEYGSRAQAYVAANHSTDRLPSYLQELYRATLS